MPSMFRRPRISGSSPLPSRLARSISTAKAWAIAVRSAGSMFGESISSSRLILNRKARLRGVTSMDRKAGSDSATWPCSLRQPAVGIVAVAAMLKDLACVLRTATFIPAVSNAEAGTRALRMPGSSTVGTV